jgi:hypothetical protein
MALQMHPEALDLGPQPLNALLELHGIANTQIVDCDDSLAVTHKVVGKARKGRRLTARMQRKVLAAVNAALKQRDIEETTFEGIFNYVGP